MSLSRQNKLRLSYSSIIAGIFIAIIAGIYEQDIELARIQSANFYSNTTEAYTTTDDEPKEEIITPDWPAKTDVDLTALQEINPDVIGWIYFENEPINYPILYSGDNSTYLRHTYTGEYAIAGSIFVDGRNHPDFSDTNTIIYGHNMDDDETMFSRILHFLNQEYYNDHQFFQIITNTAIYRYKIYDARIVDPTDDVYQLSKSELTSSSNYFITLSTCYNGNKNRVAASAIRIDEYNF